MEACKRIFLASGTLHRVEKIVRNAWTISGRSPASSALSPPAEDDPEQAALAKASMQRAREVYEQMLRAQGAADAVAEAKAEVANWQGSQSLPTAMPSTTKPALPNSANFPY